MSVSQIDAKEDFLNTPMTTTTTNEDEVLVSLDPEILVWHPSVVF
jgi:hypothetical protein